MGTTVKAEAGVTATPHDPWVTLNQAPQIAGRGQRVVLIRALRGDVRFQFVAGRPVFHRDDLEALRDAPDDGDSE